jgi:hypothetical protein
MAGSYSTLVIMHNVQTLGSKRENGGKRDGGKGVLSCFPLLLWEHNYTRLPFFSHGFLVFVENPKINCV